MIIEGIAIAFVGFVDLFNAIVAGDWTAAWESMALIGEGFTTIFFGILDLITTTVMAWVSTLIGIFSGFVLGVIDVFTGLSDTLVGNSIIPDMVQAIIDTFTNMIEPILSIFSTLSEGIGSILGSIFGGGGEEAEGPSFAFDPTEATTGLDQLNALTEQLNLALTNIFSVTLPALVTSIATTVQAILPFWQQVVMIITQTNMLLVEMYTIHLPMLQAVSEMTTQAMVTGFTAVNVTITQTIALVTQLISEITRLGQITKKVTQEMIKAFKALAEAMKNFADEIKTVAQTIENELVQALKNAQAAAESLRGALEGAAGAANNLGNAVEAGAGLGFSGGAGFQQGIGFQKGTLGLGMRVPGQGRGDIFGPIFLEPQEEILVTPRGQTIEGLMFDRLASAMGKSVTVNVEVGQVNDPMDLAMLTEQVKRVVSEEIN